MKKCPNCKQVFLDEYDYCLTDGVTLENFSGSDFNPADFSNAPTKAFAAPTLEFNKTTKPSLPTLPGSFAKRNWWLYFAAALLVALIGVTSYLLLKPDSPTPTVVLNPGGRWKGEWTSPNGNLYSAEVNLNDEGANNFSGQIVWTLKQAGSRRKDKIGGTAIEHIQGTFNPQTRLLEAKGIRKDDPHNIVILDKYQLTLAEDNQSLSGNSLNGKMNLRR